MRNLRRVNLLRRDQDPVNHCCKTPSFHSNLPMLDVFPTNPSPLSDRKHPRMCYTSSSLYKGRFPILTVQSLTRTPTACFLP